MTIAILVVIWLLTGFYGCVYWWTEDSNFTISDAGLALFVSISGPFTFIVGWGTHNKLSNKILIKKKEG